MTGRTGAQRPAEDTRGHLVDAGLLGKKRRRKGEMQSRTPLRSCQIISLLKGDEIKSGSSSVLWLYLYIRHTWVTF